MIRRAAWRCGSAALLVIEGLLLVAALVCGLVGPAVDQSATATTSSVGSVYVYDAAVNGSSPTVELALLSANVEASNHESAARSTGNLARSAASVVAADDATVAERVAASCGGESFTPNTRVVMANGTTQSLDQVKVGDKVLATDPATGKKGPQTVTKVWVNHDTDLMDVTIKAGGKTSVIHATQKHLFWDVTRHAWERANQLAAGDQLRTDEGALATVAGTIVIPGAADMWDLTVSTTHDFYVVTTTANVLVHNCPMIGEGGAQFTSRTVGQGKGWRIDVENPDPGGRAGQLHLQDYSGNKWQYDFETGQFSGVPGSMQRIIARDPAFQRAINTGLRYLGMTGGG